MLLTLSTTHAPATDLGYLLHKNPARAQTVEVAAGTAHVFYPEADERRCTVALLLEVDPIELVRSARGRTAEEFSLGQYVNDRPYAASSLLAVALGKAFASARRGVSKERPELADRALPLEVHVPALSCRGGAAMAERFFAPLGWRVRAAPSRWTRSSPRGVTPGTSTCGWSARCGWPTRSTTSTSPCRCSTTPSTTGPRPTRSTSCCAPAAAGWRPIPTGS